MSTVVLLAASLTALSSTSSHAAPAPGPVRATAPRASVETFHTTSSSIKVFWRGNGHGHGLSQYGARGAAMSGRTVAQILAFYYPGTTLTTLPASTVRVQLSGATTWTTVFAGTKGLKLTGFGALPTTGYTRFRLRPASSGLRLDGLKGTSWAGLKTGLPARADFSSSAGWVQLLLGDGSSTRYRGSVGAVRSGSGELTINRVSLNLYAQSVASREMPASWESAAVRAQAIAARSYAKSSMDAAGSGSAYDICDSDMCQVYGGMAHYDRSGTLQYTDDPDAVAGYPNAVLTYHGSAVFAQYAASNGGAMTDGGKPYLVSKNDPYDTAASGDPYLDESDTVSASSLASSYGLRSISSITVTKRDGVGPWGGRIKTAYVNGTTSSGAKKQVATTGFELGDNVGAYTDYLRFGSDAPAPAAPSTPTSARAVAGDAGARITWAAPASAGSGAVSGYRVSFNGHTLAVAASARSVWAGPLVDGRRATVTVRAVNAVGAGPAASLAVTPSASPQPMTAVTPVRLFSTSATGTTVDAAHPFRFSVPGHGTIPKTGVRSVQLTLALTRTSAAGVLSVTSDGVLAGGTSAVAYPAGHDVITTVSVPLSPSGTIVFRPSAGHLAIAADQQAYTAATGRSHVTAAARQTVAVVHNVPTGQGTTVSLAGRAGVTAATTGVLLGVDGMSSARTWLRFWPDGTARPTPRQVLITPTSASANTFIVPLPASHKLRVAAGAAGATARITLLGTLSSTGGRFETFPADPLADGSRGLTVGADPVRVPLTASPQVPATGVNSVWVQLTVRSSGAAGSLWAYPDSVTARPAAPAVVFAGSGSVTGTAVVRIRTTGGLALRTSGPQVHVAVDAIGYLTSR